ncbi:MAG TPA: response regulator transcription factor [Thermoanaerobaculia bacterium]|nr:response regulator transcription factor [Thermoanaerobaculia bacterium]
MIRLLVVDDHPAIRVGVQRIFARDAPDISIEEAAGEPEALDRLRAGSFSLVLLDLVLPGRSGFEALHEIKSLRPELPVLVFSMHTDGPFVLRALQEGASGYLAKDCTPEELIKAVRKVAAGGRYIMTELSELLIDRLQAPADRPLHEQLSSRELEVMRLLAVGTSLREIGNQLCVSESTVSTYRTRILRKLQLANNAQITRYVLDNHLD